MVSRETAGSLKVVSGELRGLAREPVSDHQECARGVLPVLPLDSGGVAVAVLFHVKHAAPRKEQCWNLG